VRSSLKRAISVVIGHCLQRRVNFRTGPPSFFLTLEDCPLFHLVPNASQIPFVRIKPATDQQCLFNLSRFLPFPFYSSVLPGESSHPRSSCPNCSYDVCPNRSLRQTPWLFVFGTPSKRSGPFSPLLSASFLPHLCF